MGWGGVEEGMEGGVEKGTGKSVWKGEKREWDKYI